MDRHIFLGKSDGHFTEGEAGHIKAAFMTRKFEGNIRDFAPDGNN
jgi:hypothetical protein